MVLNLENVNCVTLQDEELMMVNGGLAPIVIGGVVVGWRSLVEVAGVIAASGAAGIAAGYYANRPLTFKNRWRLTMFKELIKYLPELIILLMSLLYNIARNDE